MSTSPTHSERPPRPTLGKIVGELFVTAGVILMLFVVYELYWTNIAAARLQKQATAELEEQWSAEPTVDVGAEPVPPSVPAHG